MNEDQNLTRLKYVSLGLKKIDKCLNITFKCIPSKHGLNSQSVDPGLNLNIQDFQRAKDLAERFFPVLLGQGIYIRGTESSPLQYMDSTQS